MNEKKTAPAPLQRQTGGKLKPRKNCNASERKRKARKVFWPYRRGFKLREGATWRFCEVLPERNNPPMPTFGTVYGDRFIPAHWPGVCVLLGEGSRANPTEWLATPLRGFTVTESADDAQRRWTPCVLHSLAGVVPVTQLHGLGYSRMLCLAEDGRGAQ